MVPPDLNRPPAALTADLNRPGPRIGVPPIMRGGMGGTPISGQPTVGLRAARLRALITARSEARTIDSLIPTPQ